MRSDAFVYRHESFRQRKEITMRIISGSARGRRLESPEGLQVRPTTDRVKEAMFSILQFDLEGTRVLDLFSGSGQLGLEALSRGAKNAVFVDSDRRSLAITKKNIALAGFEDVSTLVHADALQFLQNASQTFDVVLMDPPYDKGLCAAAAELLPRLLHPGSVVICETHESEALPASIGPLDRPKTYRYSATKLTVYRSGGETG